MDEHQVKPPDESSSTSQGPLEHPADGLTSAEVVAEEAPHDPSLLQPQPTAPRRRRLNGRTVALALGLTGLLGLLVAEAVFITKESKRKTIASAQPTASVEQNTAPSVVSSTAVPASSAALPVESAATAASGAPVAESFSEEGNEAEEPKPKAAPKHFKTVQDASKGSCSTSSVDGLSRQIIEQVRCQNSRTFAPVPARPNLILDQNIYAYLEQSARDSLVKTLDAHPKQTMVVHSALRTVAQQYLVWKWSANKRCGVPLATPPGSSNHEFGRALDIADHALWRPALEAQSFRWLGSSDIVHFDFKTNHVSGPAPDVLAFQKLWNRNHPDDRIGETGHYDGPTEERLKQSPPAGFASGPSCAKRKQKPGASK